MIKTRRIGQVLCQRGQVPEILPPVVTQSFARETLLNQPDILVGDLVDLAGSSPPVAQVKNLRLVSVTDPSTKISTVNNDKFMVSVHETLGASCSFQQSLLHKGSTETGVIVTSPNVLLQEREVTEIQAEKSMIVLVHQIRCLLLISVCLAQRRIRSEL